MKRAFSLLEIMVAFVLLAMAASIIGIQMNKAIQKKKFHTQVERLRDRLNITQKLAVAMQSDWRARLHKESKKWLFESKCIEPDVRELKPLNIDSFEVTFNGKRVELLEFDFYSTGLVKPEGILMFKKGNESIYWKTSDFISFTNGLK